MRSTARLRRPALLLMLALLLAPLALGGCEWLGGGGAERESTAAESAAPEAPAGEGSAQSGTSPAQAAEPAAAQDPSADEPVIVALGDSLTAGFGLPVDESYPSLLQQKLKAAGYPHRVVNAGVSGDTSAGALARLDWIFRQPIDIMIVCLGGNDGLRGLSAAAMQENLTQIVERAQAKGIRVLLAGMQVPSNYGPDYQRDFQAVFPAVARQTGAAFLPFLLEGVAADPDLNQPDRIHPNTAGTRIVAETVWEALQPLLQQK